MAKQAAIRQQPIRRRPVASGALPASTPISLLPPAQQSRQQPPEYPSPSRGVELEGDIAFRNVQEGRFDNDDDDDSNDEPPPPYGEFPDQLSFSQDNVDAGAQITDDGRVDIAINTKTRALADAILRHPSVAASDAPLPPAYIPPSLGGQPGQIPPPRLNVVIQIVGSRGDVQPFVALGQVLRDTYHHRVRIATHPTFQTFVEDAGLEFFSISGDPAELMAFMVKNPGLLPGREALRNGEIGRRRKAIEGILNGCWRSCTEAGNGLGPPPPPHARDAPVDETYPVMGDPNNRPFVADAIIANPPSFAHIHVAEKLGIPLHMMFTMPWSPTKAFPHPLANVQSSNADDAITNYVTYTMIEMMTWQGLGDVINGFRETHLGLVPLSLVWAPGLLTRLRVPYTYCWSPALIPKPNDWGNTIDISGFYFLDLAKDYVPDPDLAAFLAAGPPPVYIGFGSIVVDDPNRLTRLIFDAIHLAGCRALVSKGWGGLGAEDVGLPEGVFMLGNVPHDWLFQHVSCVVHHGGAGTTSAGIKAGKPTVVVPFFGDQPFWGAMISRAGAGPDPLPYKEIKGETLAAAIEYCLKPETMERAKELGEKIREEKGTDVGGQSFHSHLDMDALRCSLSPSRAAVWRVRRSNVRLSAFAADALVKSNQIKYSDLKLYRSREYNTDDQPWDPVTATVSAFVTDVGGLFLGVVADMPRGAYKAAQSRLRREPSPSPPEPEERAASLPDEPSMESFPLPNIRDSMVVSSLGSSPFASQSQLSLMPSELPSDPIICELPGTELVLAGSSSDSSPQSPASTTSPRRATVASALALPDPGVTPPSAKAVAARPQFDAATLEAALSTGKEINKLIAKGAKTPMNFCLGLAKGFRNAPKLYNDDTVRPAEKVTGLASGLKIAGKEFGFGIYDGVSGLVTQPWNGARKEGGIGFLKGVGKGIGGAFLKPAGAIVAPVAYTMQGIHAQIKNAFATSIQNYVVSARVHQGQLEYLDSTPEERADIVARWRAISQDLKSFYVMKSKQKGGGGSGSAPSSPPMGSGNDTLEPPPSRMSWFHRRRVSSDDRRALGRTQTEPVASSSSIALTESASTAATSIHDAEFEQAIQASVAETSRGDQAEDRAVEMAIRSSVASVRRNGNKLPDAVRQTPAGPSWYSGGHDAVELDVTDQQYQGLIQQAIEQSLAMATASDAKGSLDEMQHNEEFERAVRESMAGASQARTGGAASADAHDDEALQRAIEESKTFVGGHGAGTSDEDLQRAMEASRATETPRPMSTQEEEELRRVMHESEAAHAEAMERESAARMEEEVVLAYVKRQSLAEQEYRRKMDDYRRQMDKGKMREGEHEEEDEELAAALKESLSVSEKTAGESSGAAGTPDA